MMANSSTPNSPEFEGFTEKDLMMDFNDPHEGSLYTSINSEKTFSISIKFFAETDFKKLCKDLRDLYVFNQNKNKTGSEAHTTIAEQNVVIHMYPKSTNLHIQGTGCFLWKNNIFRNLSGKLKLSPTESPEIHTTPKSSRLSTREADSVLQTQHDTPHPQTKSPLAGILHKIRQKSKNPVPRIHSLQNIQNIDSKKYAKQRIVYH